MDVPEGDAQKGKIIFTEQCGACHALAGDSKNAGAPALGGVLGREAGKGTNFPYSKAMKGSGITWSDKHLWAYINNPGKHVPGNKMAFAGLKNPEDLANIIAYLKETE